MNSITTQSIALSFATAIIICAGISLTKKSHKIKKLETRVEYLELVHITDSLALEQATEDYTRLWEENQIFTSMLGQIENEPGGHEILKKLWDEHK